jgi:branched-chain amino acid transport system permease protein
MEWVNTIVQGVLTGGLYAMFAAGLSLIFGVMRLVNIAHGDFIVLAAYLALVVTETMGLDPLVSLIVVVPMMAAIGYVLQRGLLNLTLGDDLLPPLLVTFGLSVIIQNALLLKFTADSRRLQAGALEVASWDLGQGVSIGLLPLLQFVAAVVVIGALQALFYRTAFGRAFRATSDDPAVAQLMGLDNRHVFALAMALSLAVVAIAGVLLAVRANFDPSIGPARLIFGFEAVIIGGLGNLWGTLAARPRRQARGPVSEDPRMSATAVQVRFADLRSEISLAAFATLVVALAFAPWWGGRDDLRLLGDIFAHVALASLWNLLAGYAGLVSVGQQAFVGLGGYMLFALTILADVPPLWAIPLAGLVGAIASIPVAALVFRLRGHYFAIGTWVVAEVFRLLASQVSALGGGSGTSLPASVVTAIAETRAMREFVVYWIALALAVAIIALILLLLRSRYGLALTAIRDNELAARSNGVDVIRVKLVIYVFTACGTAMVGALIFLQKLRISPDAAFSVNDWTAFVIFITVIGGIGRIEGPIIGTIVFFALRQTLADQGPVYLLMLGAVAIVVMLKAPKGIWGVIVDKLDWQIFPLQRRVVLPPAQNPTRSSP